MHIDLSTSHERFAAYQTSIDDFNTFYENWKGSSVGQDSIRGQQESTDYLKSRDSSNDAYRNAALSQSGAASRAANQTSRANAQLAAKTQLKSQKMQIDASYRQFRERLNELDIPTLNLDQWYKGQMVGLAKANLALEARGPKYAFQAATVARQLDPSGMPASLAAMARNQPLAAFEGQSGTPEAMTYDSLAQQYGIGGSPGAQGGATGGDDAMRSKALEAMRIIAARGPQGQAPGSLESMTDYERDIFSSGLEELGYDSNDWYQRYQRAGVGQGDYRAA